VDDRSSFFFFPCGHALTVARVLLDPAISDRVEMIRIDGDALSRRGRVEGSHSFEARSGKRCVGDAHARRQCCAGNRRQRGSQREHYSPVGTGGGAAA
jgi:hypothetical protein